jgi:hypothetical protein
VHAAASVGKPGETVVLLASSHCTYTCKSRVRTFKSAATLQLGELIQQPRHTLRRCWRGRAWQDPANMAMLVQRRRRQRSSLGRTRNDVVKVVAGKDFLPVARNSA